MRNAERRLDNLERKAAISDEPQITVIDYFCIGPGPSISKGHSIIRTTLKNGEWVGEEIAYEDWIKDQTPEKLAELTSK